MVFRKILNIIKMAVVMEIGLMILTFTAVIAFVSHRLLEKAMTVPILL